MESKFWQTAMGYNCHGCGATFLIGWRVIGTYLNLCDDCKKHSHKKVRELIW